MSACVSTPGKPRGLVQFGAQWFSALPKFSNGLRHFWENVAAAVPFHIDDIIISRGRAQAWVFFKSPQLPPSGPRLRTKSALLDGSSREGLSPQREPVLHLSGQKGGSCRVFRLRGTVVPCEA